MKRDDELMLLHDGELSDREARAAEERAAASPEDRARLQAMREIGDLLRARVDLAVEEAVPGLDGLWDRIEARLEPPEAPRRVGRGGWLHGAGGYVLTGLVCAAAGALLMFAVRPPRDKIVTQIVEKRVEVPAAEPTVVAAEARDAEVESLEVVGGTGTVIHIPRNDDDEDDAPTTVIWVTRDEPAAEDPI